MRDHLQSIAHDEPSRPADRPGARVSTARVGLMDDTQLIARLVAGDAVVIAEVRVWIGGAMGRYRGRLGNDFEDLEQEVLLDLLESLDRGKFRGESRLATYVHSYARFKCVDRLRAQGRRDMVEIEDDAFTAAEPSPLEELASRESEALSRQVAAALPEQCRELWEMVADGLSYREMSAATGLSEGAIRVRVHRCRQRALALREEILARRGR